MNEPITRVLQVPGAELYYDVRPSASGNEPPLLMIGSPMSAAGFNTLVGYFTDRTVMTYDPRGCDRSKRTDGATESTPDEHAGDLQRLISALDWGPVDIFGSSGGGINGLALVARHPRLVRVIVAHEPPSAVELPDSAAVLAAAADIRRTFVREGFGPAMAKFLTLVSHEGQVPDGFADRPAPDPAEFGLPTADDGSRDDPMMQNIVTTSGFRHDFDALRTASTRIIVGAGADNAGEMTNRTAVAVAKQLGDEPVIFPGGHEGFLGGEFGMTGKPEAFAAKLREMLAELG